MFILKKLITYIIFFIVLLSVNYYAQIYVNNHFSLSESLYINSFLSITKVYNQGSTLTFLSNYTGGLIPLCTILGVIFAIFSLYQIVKYNRYKLFNIGWIFFASGVFSNLFDYFSKGYTLDFLAFHTNSYNFPLCNLADVNILIGFIIICVFKRRYYRGR